VSSSCEPNRAGRVRPSCGRHRILDLDAREVMNEWIVVILVFVVVIVMLGLVARMLRRR
jgi:hypothetical protein